MWVNSKRAAEILGVSDRALQKSTKLASQKGKKICSVKHNILCFTYTDGVGRGGKTLQIWIDDNLINDENGEISQQSAPAPICSDERDKIKGIKMKIKMVIRQNKYFVKLKYSQADKMADNAMSATRAFVKTLATAWDTSEERVAEELMWQLNFIKNVKKWRKTAKA